LIETPPSIPRHLFASRLSPVDDTHFRFFFVQRYTDFDFDFTPRAIATLGFNLGSCHSWWHALRRLIDTRVDWSRLDPLPASQIITRVNLSS
jgi:hypothetical protein